MRHGSVFFKKVRGRSQSGQRQFPLYDTHHQLAGEALLCVAVTQSQSGEELGHALALFQGGVALKGLLDEPTQLLGLMHTHTNIECKQRNDAK